MKLLLKQDAVSDSYKVYHNSVYMGDFIKNVDGFYVYFPDTTGGYWDEYILMLMLNSLKEINKEWTESINDFFNKERKLDS